MIHAGSRDFPVRTYCSFRPVATTTQPCWANLIVLRSIAVSTASRRRTGLRSLSRMRAVRVNLDLDLTSPREGRRVVASGDRGCHLEPVQPRRLTTSDDPVRMLLSHHLAESCPELQVQSLAHGAEFRRLLDQRLPIAKN